MITGPLKPYRAYKDSGVEWLGEVPANWEVIPNHALLIEQRKKVGKTASSYTLLSLTLDGIIPRDMEKPQGKFPAEFDTYTIVDPDNLVFCFFDIDETPRTIGLSERQGMITGAYCVYKPTKLVDPRYFYYYYLGLDHGKRLKPLYSGLRKTISRGVFASTKSPVPPLAEQTAIVRYLDYMDRRVRRLTRAKRKLVTLLKEAKQIAIHRAVTRGLDPDVAMKDSGVEWLGELPTHWEVRRLKHWVKINQAVLSESTDADYEFDYLDIGSVGTGRLTADTNRLRFGVSPSRARRVVRAGDTIISTVRIYLKSVWYAEYPAQDLIASTGFAILTPSGKIVPKFISYVVQSDMFIDCVTSESIGMAYPAISESKLGAFEVGIPPTSEQTAITSYLNQATVDIDTAIDQANREIELLDEYRTRLISDVVTGKLDVREAAAALPTVDPLAAADNTDAAGLGETSTEAGHVNASLDTAAVRALQDADDRHGVEQSGT